MVFNALKKKYHRAEQTFPSHSSGGWKEKILVWFLVRAQFLACRCCLLTGSSHGTEREREREKEGAREGGESLVLLPLSYDTNPIVGVSPS